MPIPELRVHGVSGTPPRDMLYTDPVESRARGRTTESQRHVKVYRVTDERDFGVRSGTKAFHWGGLTSGSWLTAFWVLMLPFSMANLAGWSAKERDRPSVTWTRLFGLMLTAVFINMALIATVDVYWQWAAGEGNRHLWAALIVGALGWGWWGVVSWASTRSHFDSLSGRDRRRLLWHPDPAQMAGTNWEDPAERGITDPELWEVHPILHRLRRIHFGLGFLILAFAAAVASDTGWEIPGLSLFDIPTGVVLAVIVLAVVVLIATRGETAPRWLQITTALQPHVGALLLAGSIALIAVSGVETSQSGHWPHLRDTSAVLLGLATVTLGMVWALAGRVSASSLTLGVFFGLVMGAGAVFGLEEMIGGGAVRIAGLDWLAAGVLVWLLTAALVVVVILIRRVDRSEPDLWVAVHRTTGSLLGLFWALPATGLAFAVAAIASRCADIGQSNLFDACFQSGSLSTVEPWVGWVVAGTVAAVWLGAVVLLLRVRRRLVGVGVLLVVPVLVWLFRDASFTVAGIELSYKDVKTAARTFAILLPASLIFTRMIRGIRGGVESRRGTAVIWDVVMFWPRWFHPLAPPAYGPHAVTRLRREVERRLHPAEGQERTLILAAHSQGTIISTLAVSTLAGAICTGDRYEFPHPERLDGLGWITYGCPLIHLYDNYFPSARFDALARSLAEHFESNGSSRWVNLYRPTDPIGGPVAGPMDVVLPDPLEVDGKVIYLGHSNYEPTGEFREQRRRVEGLLEQT